MAYSTDNKDYTPPVFPRHLLFIQFVPYAICYMPYVSTFR